MFDDASTQHFFDCLTKPGCVAEGFLGVGPGDDRGIVFQLDGHEREVGTHSLPAERCRRTHSQGPDKRPSQMVREAFPELDLADGWCRSDRIRVGTLGGEGTFCCGAHCDAAELAAFSDKVRLSFVVDGQDERMAGVNQARGDRELVGDRAVEQKEG